MAGKFSALFEAQDMTVGKPMTNLLRFSVPLLIGNLAQQLYSIVDRIVVGNYAARGDDALGAISISFPIISLLLVLFMGVSMGASVMAAQYYGAKDKEQLSTTIGTTLTATFVISVMIMIVGPLITHPVMTLLGTPAEKYDYACEYLIICTAGFLGSAYFNVISGVLRGIGDSVWPVVFLLAACGINIVLDIVFVAGFHWEVAGAAWATVISQWISGAMCVIRLLRMKDVLVVTPRELIPRKRYVLQLIHLGLPSGVTQAIFSLAMIIVQSLTNTFDVNSIDYAGKVITANSVVASVDGFAMIPTFTFGSAMTTYAGQNIGAGQLDRTREGTKAGLILALGVSGAMVAAILAFGPYLMRLFTRTDAIVDLGTHMMRTLAVGYLAMAVTQVLSGVMRGAGDTMTPMWISLITTVAIRVPVAYGLEFFTRPEGKAMGSGSPDALYLSMLISWVIGATLTVIAYKRGAWQRKSIVTGAARMADTE